MVQMTDKGQKVYSSIELHPQFAFNGKAYVMGLAMTDTPASLGTERLKFAAQQRLGDGLQQPAGRSADVHRSP
jgi:hypothetical protein